MEGKEDARVRRTTAAGGAEWDDESEPPAEADAADVVAAETIGGDELDAMPVEPEAEAAPPESEPEPATSAASGAPRRAFFVLPDATKAGPPRWARIPRAGATGQPFRFPRGIQAVFLRFEGPLTRAPEKGDRQCICWELDDLDERSGISRAMGDPNRVPTELAKQMIRIVDGRVGDWSGVEGPASVETFWHEIGARYRTMMVRLYTQIHVMTREEQARFFETCVEVRSTG